MTIRTTGTRVVYENRWLRLREDAIEYSDGSAGIYGVVEKIDFVVVIALEGEHLWLVEQYRHPVGERSLELPQGAWEHDPRADPAAVARGELEEETGLRATSLEPLGRLAQAIGYSNQGMHVFLATGLEPGRRRLDHEEQGLTASRVRVDEFERMARAGVVTDATSIAAYGLLLLHGGATGGR